MLDLVEHIAHGDARHAVHPVFHRDRIAFARFAVRVDDEIVKLAIRARAARVGVAHQAHHWPIERHRHVERSRVGREHQRRCVENAYEISQTTAERRFRFLASTRLYHPFGVEFTRRATTNEHRLQPEVEPQRVRDFGPALWHPVFLLLARCDDDRCDRAFEAGSERLLPFTLVWPRTQISHDWLVWNVQGRQKLEILILYMLHGMRRDVVRREQPVEVARPRAVEAQLHRRVCEARHDAGLEVDLQVDHEVELSRRELATDLAERAPTFGTVEQNDVVDGRMAAHECCRPWLEHPGDVCARRMPLERVDYWQDVHCVAHRAHHHDAY